MVHESEALEQWKDVDLKGMRQSEYPIQNSDVTIAHFYVRNCSRPFVDASAIHS
jgi:hypothetical protein